MESATGHDSAIVEKKDDEGNVITDEDQGNGDDTAEVENDGE